MSALTELIADGRQVAQRPWPRAVIARDGWLFAARALADEAWAMLAHWAEPGMAHLALFESATGAIGVVSIEALDGFFPSIGLHHPPARRPERVVHERYGLTPDGAPDLRGWLDHQRPYPFLPVQGESLHQIPVGPVHAGIIEPGHFRFTASGETIVRLEERLGYVHKGIESLLEGASIAKGAKLASRASGDTTVAYGIGFARAVEAASGATIPSRAAFLRALMLELERIANHLGDIGAICNDAAFSLMHAHCGILRERVLRACEVAFGHRLMMDRVVPGGVVCDIDDGGRSAIAQATAQVRDRFPHLLSLYEDTASLQDRTVGTGYLKPELARRFAAGGYVGRASGRCFDARRVVPVAPYDALVFDVPVTDKGDVDARVFIRGREIVQSLSLVDQILERLPGGALLADLDRSAGEGASLVEGFRGDIFVWLRIDAGGSIVRCHLRDPSWFQWPLLEAAIEGNIVADFPLCNKSFNCSYAGHDL